MFTYVRSVCVALISAARLADRRTGSRTAHREPLYRHARGEGYVNACLSCLRARALCVNSTRHTVHFQECPSVARLVRAGAEVLCYNSAISRPARSSALGSRSCAKLQGSRARNAIMCSTCKPFILAPEIDDVRPVCSAPFFWRANSLKLATSRLRRSLGVCIVCELGRKHLHIMAIVHDCGCLSRLPPVIIQRSIVGHRGGADLCRPNVEYSWLLCTMKILTSINAA